MAEARTVTFEDVQCGRCGSSMSWENCDGCDGGLYEEEGDCPACDGKGGWWVCLSDWKDTPGDGTTWCERNPNPGREDVPCSSREDFAVYSDGTTAITGRSWTDDLGELSGQKGTLNGSGTTPTGPPPSDQNPSYRPPATGSSPLGDVGA